MNNLQVLIYLHGFASGPESRKATFLRERLLAENNSLKFFIFDYVPSQSAFSEMRLSNLLLSIETEIPKILERRGVMQCHLVGSSFGGFLAAWFAQEHPESIESLILIAPALRYSVKFIQSALSASPTNWKSQGFVLVDHYRYQKPVPLNYSFYQDLVTFPPPKLTYKRFKIPTLILHGRHDQVVPVSWSEEFARENSKVTLKLLPGDHRLAGLEEKIWTEIKDFAFR